MDEKRAINGRVIVMEDYGTLPAQRPHDDDTVHIIDADELVSARASLSGDFMRIYRCSFVPAWHQYPRFKDLSLLRKPEI